MIILCTFFRYNTKGKDISKKISDIVRISTRKNNRSSKFGDSDKNRQSRHSLSHHNPEDSENVNLLLNEKIVTISKYLFFIIYLCK